MNDAEIMELVDEVRRCERAVQQAKNALEIAKRDAAVAVCPYKEGDERQTVTVTASCAPYLRDFGKGRKAMYVTVYGYEGKWTVPASKLRIAEKV